MKSDILKLRYMIKKNLIKFAEKLTIPEEGSKELQEFCVTQLLKLAKNLRVSLKVDESSYRYIANIGHGDARSFYLYSVISEIMKIAIVNMRTIDFILDSEEEDKYRIPKAKKISNDYKYQDEEKLIQRAIFEGFINEHNLWRRKLSECLCDLICFSECKEQAYFKLFIAANELSRILYATDDFKEFFSCEVGNFKEQAVDAFKIIKDALGQTDRDKCWFLDNTANFGKLPKNGDFVASYRKRFMRAITLANKGEKVVLGFTYQVGYGGASKSMHFETQGPSYWNLDFDYIKSGVNYLSMLAYHILNRAYAINHTEPPKIGETIFKEIANGSGATEVHFLSTIKDHDIGDLVTVGGNDLSEILNVRTSKYGYKCYHVRYLVNPALASVQEEWLPARYVQKRVMKKSKAREFFEDMLKRNPNKKSEIEMILQMPDELIFKSMKEVFIDLAKHGILQKELEKSALKKKEKRKL